MRPGRMVARWQRAAGERETQAGVATNFRYENIGRSILLGREIYTYKLKLCAVCSNFTISNDGEAPMPEPTHPTRPSTSGQDRRVFVRVGPKTASPVLSVSQEEDIISWKASVRDISVGGVCLLLNGTFKPGTVL